MNDQDLYPRVDALVARRLPHLPAETRLKVVREQLLSGSWRKDALGRLHRVHSHTFKAQGLEVLAEPDHEERVESDARISALVAGREYTPPTARQRPPLTPLEERLGGRLEEFL